MGPANVMGKSFKLLIWTHDQLQKEKIFYKGNVLQMVPEEEYTERQTCICLFKYNCRFNHNSMVNREKWKECLPMFLGLMAIFFYGK